MDTEIDNSILLHQPGCTGAQIRFAPAGADDLDALNLGNVAYEVIRRAGREADFAALGIAPHEAAASASALYERIEQELYARSLAQYEHDFHVSSR